MSSSDSSGRDSPADQYHSSSPVTRVYICQSGKDIYLPEDLWRSGLLISPNQPEADRFFAFVDAREQAEYFLFPYDLTPVIQQIGVAATANLLRSSLPDFDRQAARYIFRLFVEMSG